MADTPDLVWATTAPLIGLVAGQPWSASSFSKDEAAAISAGITEALADMKRASEGHIDPSTFFRSRKDTGKDYFDRGLGVLMGIFGNVKAQSVYFSIPKDDQGALLDGSKHRYALTFTAEELPPVKYFWSLTVYRLPQRLLVENSIDRDSIGSATPGLKTAADGSITIYFQSDSPGEDKDSNRLPAPNGSFWPVMRTYGPGQAIREATWKPPMIKRVD